MGKLIDLTGQQFGRLTVIRIHDGRNTYNQILWFCECDCGNTINVLSYSLQNHRTKSCGCYRREVSSKNKGRSPTHGHKRRGQRTLTYSVWTNMKARCYNPSNISYRNYGGRGIAVCERWRKSFENFLNDMGEKPTVYYQIDRIDNEGNYEPDNCRWVTRIQNGRNTRHNRLLTYNGKTQCISAWSEEIGIHTTTLRGRLKRGWSIERAITEPRQENCINSRKRKNG